MGVVDSWQPNTPAAQVMITPWYCATHQDARCYYQAPANPSTGAILTRDNGEPLLSHYCGIWNPTRRSRSHWASFEIYVARVTPFAALPRS